MTAGTLLQIILRRWYVAIACLAAVMWVCLVFGQTDRTYWAQAQIVFVEPGGGSVSNVNDGVAPSLINFAGIVQRKVSGDGEPVQLPSSNATLYGSGVRRGYSITLPNTGNQWATSFSKPVLAIQVTGDSPEAVNQTLAEVVGQVKQAAFDLQSDTGARQNTFIGVDASPAAPDIVDVGSTPLGRGKALAVMAGIGVILSGCAAYGAENLAVRWLRRRPVDRRSQA